MSSPIATALVILLASILSVILAKRFSFSPIIGYFLFGALLGSTGLLHGHEELIHFLGEIGICFLMFDVGLNLSIKKIREAGLRMFLIGFLQLIISTVLLAAALGSLGVQTGAAVFIGATLSLSSTALILKVLSDRHEAETPIGSTATGVLVLQDIVAILLLVLLHGMTGSDTISHLGSAAVKVVITSALFVILGRKLLRPVFSLVVATKTDDVFTATALLLVLFASWLTESIGLSLALGAFLGGLALSESNFSYLLHSEISPFRGLLLALFFLAIGMSLELSLIQANFVPIVGLTILFMALKAIGTYAAARLSGYELCASVRLGGLLAQGSEFAFVLLMVAKSQNFIPAHLAELVKAGLGLSLLIAPFVANFGLRMSKSACHLHDEENEISIEDEKEIVIVEFDEWGRRIAQALIREEIPYRGHDRDWERIVSARTKGFEVYHSDPERPRTLSRASIGEVRAVICLVEDDEICRLLVTNLLQISPNLVIVGATNDPKRLELLFSLGIEDAFMKTERGVHKLYESLLTRLSFEKEFVDEALSRFPGIRREEIMPELEMVAV